MPTIDISVLNSQVGRVFKIDDVTTGDPLKDKFLARYRGRLISEDSEQAYDMLAEAMRPYEITPLFRIEKNEQVVYLIGGVIETNPSNPRTNLIMFVLTLVSVMLTGTMYSYTGPLPPDFIGAAIVYFQHIWMGWPFAVSLLSILGAHEFGHYLMGRYRKTAVTLPYFIPMPLSILGTMGAFIQMKGIPRNRRVLFDIGVAGPIAGLVVAIPVLLYGLYTSRTGTVAAGGVMEGNSLLYLLMKYIVYGKLVPAPISYDINPLLYWVRYFFTGAPTPIGGFDVQLNDIAWAGWAGLLVTSLNLIPAGQLDGGHVMYVLFGKRLRFALPFILAALFLLGWYWSGWWIWAVILLAVGRQYAEPLDQITQLDPTRRILAVLMILVFIFVFIPVPLKGL